VTAIAPCTLPDPSEPFAQQMRVLTDLADYAMRMARAAVELFEASLAPQPESTTSPRRRQPDPGALFIRAARVVQNCIIGQNRLAAGLPIAPFTLPRAAAPQIAKPAAASGEARAEPLRQALRTVTRNHPHGEKLLRAGLENLATALAADGQNAFSLPDLLRRVCDKSGIRLEPAHWRKITRDPAFGIRAAPA
jgi:hypothetical protein